MRAQSSPTAPRAAVRDPTEGRREAVRRGTSPRRRSTELLELAAALQVAAVGDAVDPIGQRHEGDGIEQADGYPAGDRRALEEEHDDDEHHATPDPTAAKRTPP